MSFKCPPAPANKKEYIKEVGSILVKDYGKKKYYKPEEVKKASKKSKKNDSSGFDWHCWAMCTFSSHPDFDRYHYETGEVCDYVAMKTEMLENISASDASSWIDIPDFNIDASWLDFGDIFDGILEGIGEFFSAILDS